MWLLKFESRVTPLSLWFSPFTKWKWFSLSSPLSHLKRAGWVTLLWFAVSACLSQLPENNTVCESLLSLTHCSSCCGRREDTFNSARWVAPLTVFDSNMLALHVWTSLWLRWKKYSRRKTSLAFKRKVLHYLQQNLLFKLKLCLRLYGPALMLWWLC